MPFVPAGNPAEDDEEELEIHRLRREQYEGNQQIEAQNRFKVSLQPADRSSEQVQGKSPTNR